jgi:hypothetical protein
MIILQMKPAMFARFVASTFALACVLRTACVSASKAAPAPLGAFKTRLHTYMCVSCMSMSMSMSSRRSGGLRRFFTKKGQCPPMHRRRQRVRGTDCGRQSRPHWLHDRVMATASTGKRPAVSPGCESHDMEHPGAARNHREENTKRDSDCDYRWQQQQQRQWQWQWQSSVEHPHDQPIANTQQSQRAAAGRLVASC